MIWVHEVAKGDRIQVQNADNNRWLVEITSTSQGALRGKRIENGKPVGRVQKVYAWQLIGRDGGPIEKNAANLIAGDLIDTPSHKSGLQYAKVVKRDKWGNTQCVRWNEANGERTKHPRHLYFDDELEWLGHESDEQAVSAFHQRVGKDREMWQASPGWSRFAPVPGEDHTYYFKQKERRWQGEEKAPVRFAEPEPWPEEPPPTKTWWQRLFG